jgi:hypothetical protein
VNTTQEDAVRILVRVFCLMTALLWIPSLSAQPITLTFGETLEGFTRRAQFQLDAEAGQTVTLRWEGRHVTERCDGPLEEVIHIVTEATDAEGDALEEIGLLYTPSSTTHVYSLEGTPPYNFDAVICGGAAITLHVLEGDAIPRVEQPALNIGDTASVVATSVGQDQLLVFPLNVQAGDVFTVNARLTNTTRGDDYPMYAAVVRDANGHIVPSDFSDRLPLWLNLRVPVYTAAGAAPYTLEFPAIPLYNAGYAVSRGEVTDAVSYSIQLESGNTAIVDAGILPVGTRVEGVLSLGTPVIYTLDVEEEEIFTLRREMAGPQEVFFVNGDGENAYAVDFLVNTASTLIWAMRLHGTPPYTYYFQGEGSYAVLLEEGDTIQRNEIGRLAPGERLQVAIPAQDDRLDYLALDVTPETTVTLHWGIPQTEFTVFDSTGRLLFPINDDWTDGFAIVDLSQGTPPFVVSLDDARYAGKTITFTLAEGETPLLPGEAAAAGSSGGSAPAATQSQMDTQSSTGGCTVSAGSSINQRSGPGTNFDVAGTLAGSANADGQTTGADGFTWYRLTTGGWVRGDLVTASAECAGLPEVTQ